MQCCQLVTSTSCLVVRSPNRVDLTLILVSQCSYVHLVVYSGAHIIRILSKECVKLYLNHKFCVVFLFPLSIFSFSFILLNIIFHYLCLPMMIHPIIPFLLLHQICPFPERLPLVSVCHSPPSSLLPPRLWPTPPQEWVDPAPGFLPKEEPQRPSACHTCMSWQHRTSLWGQTGTWPGCHGDGRPPSSHLWQWLAHCFGEPLQTHLRITYMKESINPSLILISCPRNINVYVINSIWTSNVKPYSMYVRKELLKCKALYEVEPQNSSYLYVQGMLRLPDGKPEQLISLWISSSYCTSFWA